MRRVAGGVAAFILALSACSGGEEASRPTYTLIPSTTTTTTTVVLPSTTLQDQVEWVVDRLITATDVGIDEVEDRFAPVYLSEVTAEQLIASTRALSADVQQWKTVKIAQTDQTSATALVEADEVPLNITVTIDDAGLITLLLLQPAAAPGGSVAEVLADLQAVGDASLLVAEVREDRTCSTIFRHNDDRANPIASDFKLYVLSALATAIEEGSVAWDDPLPIQRALQSLPFGTFQDLAPGTVKTVREHADAMISISDNTAADHLIDLLDREAVAAAMLRLDHSDPALNIPFLSTLEWFKLKLGLSDEDLETYLGYNRAQRAVYLDTELGGVDVDLEAIAAWEDPLRIDTLGWYATPRDLCHVIAALTTPSKTPSHRPLRDILSINPGIPQDPEVWPYVAFKGGSEPGVLSLAWYAEREDGRAFVVVANITSDEPIPDLMASNAAAVFILLRVYE